MSRLSHWRAALQRASQQSSEVQCGDGQRRRAAGPERRGRVVGPEARKAVVGHDITAREPDAPVISREEFDAWTQEVEKLRDDFARLQARIDKLEREE